MRTISRVFLLSGLASLPVLWTGGIARADGDPPLRLMHETLEYTDVADAFDDVDPFDLNVSVGFVRSLESGTLQREDPTTAMDDGRPTSHWLDVASHEHVSNTLMLGLDVGLYHDLMIYGRLPLILNDTRKLTVPDGRSATDVNADLQTPDGEQIFTVPFESPTRSGLDWLGVGAAWAILNQNRDRSGPTWVLSVEGRINIGEPLHACWNTAPSGGERCNRGLPGGMNGTEPGMSQGVNEVRLETRGSFRYRYVEPYAGLLFRIAFPGSGEKSFLPSGSLSGIMNDLPPRVGEMTVGMGIIPWEHRGRWQRFAIDTRLVATYISEGHTYTPMFDALGTSTHPELTSENYEARDAMGMGTGRSVRFVGLTDTQSHAQFMFRGGLEMQAAQYVRFTFGAGLGFTTAFLMSFTDACNPNIDQTPGDPRNGNCRNGIINPHYRDVIDLAGRRFRTDQEFLFDLYVSATGQI